MPGKIGARHRITSGDKLVDWIFFRIIHALNYKIGAIYLKRSLCERTRGKVVDYYGYIDDDIIF